MFFHTLLDTVYNGYKSEWLIILSIVAIILALSTIITKSPIYSVLYLISLFTVISLYLIASNLPFMGISYILVYVGAISILFLFILMLISVRISELLTEGKNSAVLSILVILAFILIFNTKLPYTMYILEQLFNIKDYIQVKGNVMFFNESDEIILSYLKNYDTSTISNYSWDDSLIEISHISSIGNILYNIQVINLAIVGIILLLAIVGCIITTVKPKDNVDYLKNKFFNLDSEDLS